MPRRGPRGKISRSKPLVSARQQKIASTPRASEVRSRKRKAAGVKGGKVQVKASTRKGRPVRAYSRTAGARRSASGGLAKPTLKRKTAKASQRGGAVAKQVKLGKSQLKPQRNAKGTLKARKAKGPDVVRAATARKYVKAPTAKANKTTDHTAAGLHRMGKKGNSYSNAQGEVFHRGKGGTFKPGAAKKKTSRKTARPTSRRR